nr:uncharacterized protein LOC128695048 [Cherax quadricarinatus]
MRQKVPFSFDVSTTVRVEIELAADNPRGIEPARPRLFYVTTDGSGNSIYRIPLASTINDLPVGEGVLLFGSLGTATAITLFTIAHAILFGGRTGGGRSRFFTLTVSELPFHSTRDLTSNLSLRKRDLSSLLAETQRDPEMEADFERIFAQDSDWCSLRLTCELAAKAGSPLDPQERRLLAYFKGVVSEQDLQVVPTPQLYYSYASYVGFSQGSQGKCSLLYPQCPYSAKTMMEVFKTVYSRMKRTFQDFLQPSY